MLKILLAGLIVASMNVLSVDDASINFTNTLDPVAIEGVSGSGVRHLTCTDIKTNKVYYGSAAKVGDHTLITAAHVVEDRICKDTVSGTSLNNSHIDHGNDFAIVQSPTVLEGVSYTVNCAGYKPGNDYFIAGWARGEELMFNEMVATNLQSGLGFKIDNEYFPGFHRLRGLLIRGMSGGPTFDLGGNVVGVNNFTDDKDWAWNIDLKKTAICK